MRLLMAILLGIFVFGLINNASLLNVGLLLLGVYLLFNLVQSARDNASTLKKFVDFRPLNLDKLQYPDGMVNNMLKDAGKVTKNILNGNKPATSLGMAVAKGTYNAINEAGSVFNGKKS